MSRLYASEIEYHPLSGIMENLLSLLKESACKDDKGSRFTLCTCQTNKGLQTHRSSNRLLKVRCQAAVFLNYLHE